MLHFHFLLLFLPFFLFPFSYSSYCGSYLPDGEGSCDQFTNSTFICCYLTGKLLGTFQNMCYPFDRETYYRMSRSVEINGYKYKLDCGQSRGASCGQIVNPVSYKDCGLYSTSGNSCCFYKYQAQTNCVWLGKSNIGTMVYKDLTVICGGSYLKSMLYMCIIAVVYLLF